MPQLTTHISDSYFARTRTQLMCFDITILVTYQNLLSLGNNSFGNFVHIGAGFVEILSVGGFIVDPINVPMQFTEKKHHLKKTMTEMMRTATAFLLHCLLSTKYT